MRSDKVALVKTCVMTFSLLGRALTNRHPRCILIHTIHAPSRLSSMPYQRSICGFTGDDEPAVKIPSGCYSGGLNAALLFYLISCKVNILLKKPVSNSKSHVCPNLFSGFYSHQLICFEFNTRDLTCETDLKL